MRRNSGSETGVIVKYVVVGLFIFGAGYWTGWSNGVMSGSAARERQRMKGSSLLQPLRGDDILLEDDGRRKAGGNAGRSRLNNAAQQAASNVVRRAEADEEVDNNDAEKNTDNQERGAEGQKEMGDSSHTFEVLDSRGTAVQLSQQGIVVDSAESDENQRKALQGEQLTWKEIEQLPMYRHVFSEETLPCGRRVLLCPRWQTEQDILQIPLKHLPRKRPTSVDQKYDRRASNCLKDGIWHKISLEDHKKILGVIESLLKIKPSDHVFDWGSGCGHKLRFVADSLHASGFGLDVSELSVQYSLVNTTKENHFCRANGVRIDQWMPENYYDQSLSFGSVYHVYNRTTFCSVMRSMVRVVKAGGRIYNGWTENAEFRRADLAPCMRDLPVKVEIIEERKAFSKVPVFPLKSQQTLPNTYSMLITKLKPTVPHYWTYVPLSCDKHKCSEIPYPPLPADLA